MPPQQPTFVAIITGANRGIGTAIAAHLASSPPTTPAHIYACARTPPAPAASPISLPDPHKTSTTLTWASLDISSPASVAALADRVRAEHPGGVDVLVNNAGVNVDYEDGMGLGEKARVTMATNVEGTLRMCEVFGPVMRRPGLDVEGLRGWSRVVNLSSVASHVGRDKYGAGVIERLVGAESVEDVRALRDSFLKAAESGEPGRFGWTSQCYSASKAITNALTRVVAGDERLGKGVFVNCCCPGWVDTGMGKIVGKPPKTPEEGARIPLRLATGDVRGKTGVFWENKDGPTGRGDGDVREWVN